MRTCTQKGGPYSLAKTKWARGDETSKGNKTMTKWVYSFGGGSAEGQAKMKNLLGGKGANLAERCNLGLPVPPGFTITTEVCTYFYDNKRTYPKDLQVEIEAGISFIEKIMGTKFNDQAAMPLLVSVRSGARVSMPGMMDTVLNLGLNDATVAGLARVLDLAGPALADPFAEAVVLATPTVVSSWSGLPKATPTHGRASTVA